MKEPTTQKILRTSRPSKDGTFPICLRVTYQRVSRLYQTSKNMSEEDFAKMQIEKERKRKGQEHLAETYNFLYEFENKAIEIISSLKPFSFDAFKKAMYPSQQEEKETPQDVYGYFEMYIKQLEAEKRIKTAISYKNAYHSFKAYRKKLGFEECDKEFLRAYQAYMVAQGKSLTTIGIYTRSLRAIFHLAIQDKTITLETYPFGKGKYQTPKGDKRKIHNIALKKEEIDKIKAYQPVSPSEQFAKDFFLFTYYGNGLNFKDIALLKFKNLDLENEEITFIRSKTKKSAETPPSITIDLTPTIIEIIERNKNKIEEAENYIFPIIDKNISSERQVAVISQKIKNINQSLNRIAKKLGIEKHITTYTARHTFATILKNSGESTELISEKLGHSSLKTTQEYFGKFEKEQRKQAMDKL